MTEPTPIKPPDHVDAVLELDTLPLINFMLGQMQLSEKRIVEKIDENSRAASERWQGHQKEHADLVGWIKSIDKRSKDTWEALEKHLDDERIEDARFDARFGPIQRSGRWMLREWRMIALIVALFLANIIGDTIDVSLLLGR